MVHWQISFAGTEVGLDDLEVGNKGKADEYKILRYSLQLQAKATGTEYWAKLQSSHKMFEKTGHTVQSLSKPVERQAIFNTQAISKRLADSFELEDNTPQSQATSTSTTPQGLESTESVVSSESELEQPSPAFLTDTRL